MPPEQSPMQQMSERVEAEHRRPLPGAAEPTPAPFDRRLAAWLAASVVVGALVGALVGYVLAERILIVPGWEQMYSDGSVTVVALWTAIGIALGIVTLGIAGLLRGPAAGSSEGERREDTPVEDDEGA